jgi:hypothetical protein
MPSDPHVEALAAEVTTSAYRVSGNIRTRFVKIAAILNNLDRTHLIIELATIREHVDPGRGRRAAAVIVPVDDIMFIVADTPPDPAADAIVVPKKPVPAQVAMPNFRLSGTIFVPESVESVATAVTMTTDVFVPMVNATVSCWVRPELNATYPVLAFQRRLVHVFSFEGGVDSQSEQRPSKPVPGWA